MWREAEANSRSARGGPNDLPDVISSSSDFKMYAGRPGTIDVVSRIDWCSGFAPRIAGCANTARRLPDRIPIWAHEFAHTTGRRHRDAQGALMRPMLRPENVDLNAVECRLLVGGSPAIHSDVDASDFEDGPPTNVEVDFVAAADQTTPVTEFVTEEYPGGVPYELAAIRGRTSFSLIVKTRCGIFHQTEVRKYSIGDELIRLPGAMEPVTRPGIQHHRCEHPAVARIQDGASPNRGNHRIGSSSACSAASRTQAHRHPVRPSRAEFPRRCLHRRNRQLLVMSPYPN